jgi:hypothetical protein
MIADAFQAPSSGLFSVALLGFVVDPFVIMAFREVGAAEEIDFAAVFDHQVTRLALRARFDPIRFGVDFLLRRLYSLGPLM